MKGSAKPLLLLLLVLVVGAVAAVFYLTKPAGRGDAGSGKADERVAESSSQRTATPESPVAPVRGETRDTTKRDPAAANREGWANALAGEVVDGSGAPVQNATVTAEKGPAHAFTSYFKAAGAEGPTFRATTDAKGAFRLTNLPPSDTYLVRASHSAHPPVEINNISVATEGETRLRLTFKAGFVVEGTVYDSNRNTLPGVDLALESSSAGPFAPDSVKDRREAKTDDAGRFRFENIPAGQRTLLASSPGFGSKTIPNLSIQGEARTISQDVVLVPGIAIAGQVVDETGTAVANAKVEATAYTTQEMSRGEATTGADGAFRVDGLAPGTYAVVASAPGYSKETQPRIEAGNEALTITLALLSAVEGRVYDKASGKGLASYRLEARKVTQPGSGMYGRTNVESRVEGAGDGRYVFRGLEPGRYALLAQATGYAQTYSGEFEVARGQNATGVDIALTAGGRLVGKVLDGKSGKGISGATLTTRDNTYQDNPFVDIFRPFLVTNVSSASVRTGGDGSFTLDHLMPGTYQVEIEHGSYTKKWLKDLVVQEGQDTTVPELLLFPGAILRGIAVDGGGNPIPQAQVTVRPTQANPTGGMMQRQIRTDASGRFAAKNLPPGEYDVSVTSNTDAAPNPFEVLLHWQKSKKTVVLAEGDDQEIQIVLAN